MRCGRDSLQRRLASRCPVEMWDSQLDLHSMLNPELGGHGLDSRHGYWPSWRKQLRGVLAHTRTEALRLMAAGGTLMRSAITRQIEPR